MLTVADCPVIDRREFIAERFDYREGQHLTALVPTDGGKTTLIHALMDRVATPDLPVLELIMKPKDATVSDYMRTAGFLRTYDWPPPLHRRGKDVRGWMVWPKHTFDPDVDDAELERVFRAAIRDSYRRGHRIVFADEVAGMVEELGLRRDLSAVWMRGRSMGCGLWAASQRPAFVPLHAYSQAEHLFLGYDPDVRAQQRYGEIGGIDPQLVRRIVNALPPFYFLYIKRKERYYCVIGP